MHRCTIGFLIYEWRFAEAEDSEKEQILKRQKLLKRQVLSFGDLTYLSSLCRKSFQFWELPLTVHMAVVAEGGTILWHDDFVRLPQCQSLWATRRQPKANFQFRADDSKTRASPS